MKRRNKKPNRSKNRSKLQGFLMPVRNLFYSLQAKRIYTRQTSKKLPKKLLLRKSKVHFPASVRKAGKPFLIAVIAVIAVAVLSLLLLFSDQLVGKAFFAGQANTAGIADPGTVVENQPFSLKVQVNIQSPAAINAAGFTLQLPVDCSKVVDADNDLSNGVNVQNLFGGFETKNKCENNKIVFGSLIVGTKSGTVTIAQIDFQGLPTGTYSFSFIEPFKAYDAGNPIVITVINSIVNVQGQPVAAQCGNNEREMGEDCDDGNEVTEACPDYGQSCLDICDANCKSVAVQGPFCGDGKVQGTEQCDDGNTASGDGCSSTCQVELTALCGDNICNVQFESTSSCPQDCGQVCPTNGLVAWWKGENNALDNYKLGYLGTLEGNAAYAVGRVGQAFKFDGVDYLMDLGSKTGTLSGTLFSDPTGSSLSVSFWVKTAAIKSPKGSLYIFDTGAGTDGRRGFYCNTFQGALNCVVRQASALYKVSASNVIPLNSWKFVTLTFDDASNELKLYIEGAFSKSGTEELISGLTYESPQAVIGATNTKQLHFNGSLDEVAVWNRALTSAEVKNIYDAGATGMCSISSYVCGNDVQEPGEECDDRNLVDGDGCSSTCQTESAICGDNVCEIKFESTTSCPQDCGLVCPTNRLVSWWKGEDTRDSFSSHHGTLGGNANIISGKVDNAFYFDGGGDYLTLGQKPGTIFSDPTGSSLSVSFWMRTNATKGPQGALYILDSGAGTASRRGFYCSTNQGKLDCAIKHTDIIYQVSASNVIPLNSWKFVTFTLDNAKEELKLYIDGAYASAGIKAVLASSSSPVPTSVIGATNLQTLSFNGTLDEIAVWERVLTAAEVKAIFDTDDIGMCAVPEAVCGNGFTETGEECDDGNRDNADICTNQCKNAVCGDGIIQTAAEQCDSLNLAGVSCQGLGFANGSLSCTAGCFFNSTACAAAPPPPPPPPNVTSTVNGIKISLGEIAPANNVFSTLLTATTSFSQKIKVYVILYDADGKVLKLESDEITGGMAKDASYLITADYQQAEVKKKRVLVFDVEPNPKVFAQLEKTYS